MGAEDMFLGMGNKTPATSSCEDMIVSVVMKATPQSDYIVTEATDLLFVCKKLWCCTPIKLK